LIAGLKESSDVDILLKGFKTKSTRKQVENLQKLQTVKVLRKSFYDDSVVRYCKTEGKVKGLQEFPIRKMNLEEARRLNHAIQNLCVCVAPTNILIFV